MPISIMPICAKLPLESGPALGTLSLCLKTGIIPSTSMAVSLTEGAVLKGNISNGFALGNVVSAQAALAHSISSRGGRFPVGASMSTCECPQVLASSGTGHVMVPKDKGPQASLQPAP